MFEASCKKWMDKLGLKNYSTRFTHRKMGAYAAASTNASSRAVHFSLSNSWIEPCTPAMIERCAVHEVLHVLMSSLRDSFMVAAKVSQEQRVPMEELIEPLTGKEEEGIVMTLENVLIEMANETLSSRPVVNEWRELTEASKPQYIRGTSIEIPYEGFHDVFLQDCGPNKIAVLKAIRAFCGCGLKEAVDITNVPGSLVKADIPWRRVMNLVTPLTVAGAQVGLRKHMH